MLTGHTKKLFEEWYEKQHYQSYGRIGLGAFYGCPFSMQSGVYLEFLREQGIDIEITKWEQERRECDNIRTNKYYWIVYVNNEFKSLDHECKTYEMQSDYNTALTQAIEKCNELINGEQK